MARGRAMSSSCCFVSRFACSTSHGAGSDGAAGGSAGGTGGETAGRASSSADASTLAPNTDENTSGMPPAAYGFAAAREAGADAPEAALGTTTDAAGDANDGPEDACCAPWRGACGWAAPCAASAARRVEISASSAAGSATISTRPSSSVRLDSTAASAPIASRTRRSASRLVGPMNLRMFKRYPR
ncbi:hypothetical protein D8O27_26330 [Burkholderia mallei]|nr:putative lipoprotein [Burkholderia mallei]AIS30735.1 putative lipoprotein [Burkholderia mallei NCTC 10247]AIO62426.1 putative lipoprotein [Burkholderia mallei]AIP75399.1 putative lipoprotein [Burkholderia mallei]AJX01627.1 putative lipoprotein [Burkholderia mallei]